MFSGNLDLGIPSASTGNDSGNPDLDGLTEQMRGSLTELDFSTPYSREILFFCLVLTSVLLHVHVSGASFYMTTET